MPENNIGYFLIFFCFVGGVVSTIIGLANHRVNLGVDLRGGSILVYEVSPNKDSGHDTVTNEDMNGLKNAIMRRINPSGVREISIQELGANSEILPRDPLGISSSLSSAYAPVQRLSESNSP